MDARDVHGAVSKLATASSACTFTELSKWLVPQCNCAGSIICNLKCIANRCSFWMVKYLTFCTRLKSYKSLVMLVWSLKGVYYSFTLITASSSMKWHSSFIFSGQTHGLHLALCGLTLMTWGIHVWVFDYGGVRELITYSKFHKANYNITAEAEEKECLNCIGKLHTSR